MFHILDKLVISIKAKLNYTLFLFEKYTDNGPYISEFIDKLLSLFFLLLMLLIYFSIIPYYHWRKWLGITIIKQDWDSYIYEMDEDVSFYKKSVVYKETVPWTTEGF